MSAYTEDHLVEQPAIQLLEHELGWDSAMAFGEWESGRSDLGREAKREVVLISRLKPALQSLNPTLPAEALEAAMDELTRDRSALSLVEANREIDKLLKQGVPVQIPHREGGGQETKVVQVIDWQDPSRNDFFFASQFWISGELYTRRPDVVGFVNGLPLVLMEFKKPSVNVREAFDHNLADYKETIPQIFHFNAFLIVSNGSQSKIGSLTAPWGHFSDWKKVADERDPSAISLQTLLRGTCEPSRLLDLVENFTRFSESSGAVSKLIARNHQFLGVNRAIAALGRTLTPTLSQEAKVADPSHYRGGFRFAGLVERARELRRQQTQAEELLWQLLRNRQLAGVKFRRQHQFGDYICDFYCHEAALVVECDGEVHRTDEAGRHDKKRDAYLRSQGLTVLRFTNAEVLEQTEWVLQHISEHLSSPDEGGGRSGEAAHPLPMGEGWGEGKTKRPHNGLGVFWHTQGSGKSYSMVFFAEKVFRKIAGNWTFVIITDRTELDDQIYRTFATCGAATEGHCQATSSTHLRKLLGEDHRYVFTLIHKFRTEPGQLHPVLSERDDIIVLTDEAHRSQYDTLAMNMRTALPNAKFLAFTGTPLIAGEERTREVFGDYVSVYNFKQSVDDGATVPLYYENRTPELDITNPDLNEEIYQVIEEAGLDEEQEKKLERVLGQRYHLITRDDRLEAVAKDIVHHFLNRGYQGKAMVVSIDKLTAVKMFEKVRIEWEAETERVRMVLTGMNPSHPDFTPLNERLRNLVETDRAVVVSPGQNEIAEMRSHGLDILPHRERMVRENLDDKFKKPDDPLRLVFVCAMWLTGFDAPSCSTLYLDKPMRGHTLMQTIARANRVYGEKVNGLVVDYANVFAELEKALAIYGAGSGGGGDLPVKDKAELVEALRTALQEMATFCQEHGVDLAAVEADPAQHLIATVNRLVVNDEVRESFLGQSNDIQRLYRAVMPDPIIPELAPRCQVIREVANSIRALKDPVEVTAVLGEIERSLDGSIVAEPGLNPGEQATTVDLSRIDFEALERKFARSRTRNSETQKLRALIERKLRNLIRLNASRYDYLDRFEKMIEAYNSGALTIEQLFESLVSLSRELSDEEHRHMRENLSEEELAVFDILTRPGPDLTKAETDAIKKVCRHLLAKLKTEKLVLDWRKRRTTRAAVRVAIEEMLDAGLPEKYTVDLFEEKSGALFQHLLEKYPQKAGNVYDEVA